MKPAPPEVPRLLLGVSSLDQPVRTTRDRQLEVASRFKEPESLAVALVKAVGVGADALVVPPTNDVREALAELHKDLPLLVRTPHTPVADDLRWEPSLALEVGDDSNPGSWSPARAGAAVTNLLPLSMATDLASRVWPRIEREVATFSAKSVRGILVPAAVTDLALAANQPKFFERLLKVAHSKFGLVGFETRNLGHLLSRLGPWGVAPDFVMGPVNPRGVGMMPDQARVLAEIEASPVKVIGCELRAGGMVALDEGAAYARQRGCWGVLAELVDLDDVPKELKGLVPGAAA
ncbi:MAG: hypothetical protein ABL977_01270 [Candidatus Eisenbacteria bacterium]